MAYDASQIAGRVRSVRARCVQRDANYKKLIAIRKGDYDAVAPGLFNTAEFDKPLVANLIDTTARDIAEVMAPLPSFTCQPASLSNDSDQMRQDKRALIANSYVQNSRLQDQMYGGADRYGSFGFLAYQVEPDYEQQMPVIRVSTNHSAYYVKDFRGRVREFFEPMHMHPEQLMAEFPEVRERLQNRYKWGFPQDFKLEVVRWHDSEQDALVLLDPNIMLTSTPNRLGKCCVRVVERPTLTDDGPKGQFDDVIWVQVARALVQMYTMNALERSVNAPMVLPKDVQELELGPFAAIQTDTPNAVGVVPLNLTPGLFPEGQVLAQEQRDGSRYPEGRSGSIDASIITGQGVQALMGTFDTQVQTFQRLNSSALSDVIELCFEMDEAFWPNVFKQQRIKDNGAPRKFTYTASKDINGDYTIDVTYGAIAGLDPNRGLVFLLQALAGGLLSKSTARRHLPVDVNVVAEERQIELESLNQAVSAAVSQLPLAIPQMAAGGADPRDIVMQIADIHKQVERGKSPVEAIEKVFAPKQPPQPPAASPLDAAQQAASGGPALPGQGGGGASDMLMSIAGMANSGKPNLQSNVSRETPINQ